MVTFHAENVTFGKCGQWKIDFIKHRYQASKTTPKELINTVKLETRGAMDAGRGVTNEILEQMNNFTSKSPKRTRRNLSKSHNFEGTVKNLSMLAVDDEALVGYKNVPDLRRKVKAKLGR